MALVLEVEYLSGVAFAAVSAGTDRADWPPQPDRIFSALVATWAARGQLQSETRALEWLEALPVPLLMASEAAQRTSHVSFVPPNDSSAEKQKHALHVVPQLRNRQPRRFPAVRPEDPRVRLLWPDAETDNGVLAALESLAADTSYIGHSASLTRCRFERLFTSPSLEGFKPARRRVYPGRFEELRAAFAAGSRPGPGAWVPASAPQRAEVPQSAFSDRWLFLEPADGNGLPDIRASALIARIIRDRLVEGYRRAGFGDRVPEVISGHAPDGSPSHVPHLAIVPLAFTGFPHADGHLLALALVPPRDSSLLDDQDFLSALRQICKTDDALGRRVLHLDLRDRIGNLLRVSLSPTFDPPGRSCDPDLYVGLDGSARTFATATPIVLDRHPKARGASREHEIAAQIAAACRNIGLPEPKAIETAEGGPRSEVVPDKHSAIEGAPSAEPSGKSPPWMKWQLPSFLEGRELTHAVVQFPVPVTGPVILGAGRYVGLGLCRPISARGW